MFLLIVSSTNIYRLTPVVQGNMDSNVSDKDKNKTQIREVNKCLGYKIIAEGDPNCSGQ